MKAKEKEFALYAYQRGSVYIQKKWYLAASTFFLRFKSD